MLTNSETQGFAKKIHFHNFVTKKITKTQDIKNQEKNSLRQNAKKPILKKLMVTNLKKSKCEKTNNFTLTKLKNSNFDNSKPEFNTILTKIMNLNFYKT